MAPTVKDILGVDPGSLLPTYNKLEDDNIKYNPVFGFETTLKAVQTLFRPTPLTSGEASSIYSPIEYPFSYANNSARRRLSEQARAYFTRNAVRRKQILAEDTAANDGVNAFDKTGKVDARGEKIGGSFSRLHIFLRLDDGEGAAAYNEQLLTAFRSGTAQERGKLFWNEIERTRKQAGIEKPEDVYKIMEMGDKEFVEKLPSFFRYLRLMSESEHYDGVEMTEEQLQTIAAFRGSSISTFSFAASRMALIANPHYEQLGSERLYSHNTQPSLDQILTLLEDNDKTEELEAKGDSRAPMFQPLYTFFRASTEIRASLASVLYERACIKEPMLKEAVWSCGKPTEPKTISEDILMTAITARPIVACLKDGSVRVLSNLRAAEPQDLGKYLDSLSAEADVTNRFLFTGSNEFKLMHAALKEMSTVAKTGADPDTLVNQAKNLQQLAKEYLKHKKVSEKKLNKEDGCDYANLPGGKNKREMSRIELAANILNFTKAQIKAVENLRQMEKIAPPTEKKADPVDTAPVYKESNLADFSNSMTNLMGFKTGERPENSPLKLEQADLPLLSTFAAADPNLSFKYRIANTSETLVWNNTPDRTYPELLRGLYQSKQGDKRLPINREIIPSATAFGDASKRSALKAITEADKGNLELLGKLVANGLKQNNKLLQDQKALSDGFSAFAKVGENALGLLERNPALKEAAMKAGLTQEDLQAAKAAAAISKVRIDGIKSLNNLNTRINSGVLITINDLPDIAKVAQMSAVNMQIATKMPELKSSLYGIDPKLSETVNNNLVKDANFQNLMSLPDAELQKKLNSGTEMNKVYNAAMAPKTANKVDEGASLSKSKNIEKTDMTKQAGGAVISNKH